MRKCMQAENLHARLKKVSGQIAGIQKMIDQDVPCEKILVQLSAANSALHKIGVIILEGHLNHCVREGIEAGNAETTLANFAKALEHFSNMK